jgi:hypothetical protein
MRPHGEDIDGNSSSNGMIVTIGAYDDGDRREGSPTGGHTRVYQFESDTSWVQVGDDIDDEGIGDKSGYSVSLSADGSTVAIGAIGNDDNGLNSGHVRIYQILLDSDSLVLVGPDINGKVGDFSGSKVSLSADGATVAIAAHRNEGGVSNGYVRVFGKVLAT